MLASTRIGNTSRKIIDRWWKDCPFRHSQKKNRPSQHQSFDKGKKTTNSHIWTRSTRAAKTEISKCTTVWPKVHRVEGGARNFYKAWRYQLHKELFKTKRDYSDVNEINFFGSYVSTKNEQYHDPLGDVFQRKDVHSWQWRFGPCDGFSSLNHKKKKIIRHSSKILDIQTANGIVVSHTPAKVHIEELGACPWIHLVKDYRPYCRWEDFAMIFVADRRRTPRFSKRSERYRMQRRKTSSHGCSSAIPSSECSRTKGNLEREQEVEDTMIRYNHLHTG